MKLLHIGDLHLGKSLGDYDLKDDQEYILDRLIAIADEQGVDAVLIAGDVYDKSVPSEAATAMLDSFLSRLARQNINTYLISGNHDSDERLNYGSRLFESNHIYISTKYDGSLNKYTLHDGAVEADIYLLPFIKASHVRRAWPEEAIESYDDAVRVVIEKTDIDRSRCNILVAHQFVTGKKDPALGGSEGLGTQSVGLVEKVGYDCFEVFDYVALGHIHSPQRVGREEVRYSGSPLKYSLSEVNNEKSVPLITIDGSGVRVELIPLKPLRDVRHLRGEMRKILEDPEVQAYTDDYIYVTLTDEEPENDVMGIIRQTFSRTVKIDYDNSHTREIEQVDISKIADDRPYEDLIGDFYRQVYGIGISDEEMEIMRMTAREAGVLHEAD